MGDVAAPPSHQGPVSEPAEDHSAPVTTPMGDPAAPAAPTDDPSAPSSREQQEAPDTLAPTHAPAQQTNRNPSSGAPALPDELADLPVPGYAAPAPSKPATNGHGGSITGAFGLGGTLGYARDADHTAFEIGIAEGYGLFGSAGPADAPETPVSASSAVMGGIGPISGELRVGTHSGITGTVDVANELNPAVAQTQSYSLQLDAYEGPSTQYTEKMTFGAQEGVAVTHTVTISIPNAYVDPVIDAANALATTVGGWFATGDTRVSEPAYRTGGGF
jgi:hypothetical protein